MAWRQDFCVQLVAGGCWLVAVSVGGSPLAQPGGYGHQPKCRTEYETTYKTTYETIYKPKCQTTYEQVSIAPKAAIFDTENAYRKPPVIL